MIDVPAPRRDRLAWALFGLGVAGTVTFVIYSFVGAVVTGLFLYYATRPVRDRLAVHVDHPDVNAVVSLLAVAVPLLLVLGYGGLVGVREVNQLLSAYQLDEYRSLLQPYVSLSRLTRPETIVAFVRDNATRILSYLGDVLVWLGRLFVIVVIAFYLLRDDRSISGWFRRTFGDDHDAVRFFTSVDDDLDTVYTGNLLTVGITALIAAGTFYGFDLVAPGNPTVRFPILLGLLVAAFTFVPVVGMKAVWVPYGGYLFVRSVLWNEFPVWVPVAFVAVTAVVVDFLPDIFVRSYVSKGDINMGLMLLAYTLGVLVFGWYGLFLGPLILVLALHFARQVFPKLVEPGAFRMVDE